MKVTKMPGFGSYGTLISDFDWNDPDSYIQLKEINLKSLVTVVKGSDDNFKQVARNFHHIMTTRFSGSKWATKYGPNWESMLTDTEKEIVKATKLWPVGEEYPGWMRVTGKRNNEGKPTGVFGETELLWHNDESGSACFSPLVALYGVEHMDSSATCFVQTADWYESCSESFRSELNELVSVYNWDNDKIQPGADKLNQEIIKSNMVPEEGAQLPLVVSSAGGVRGVYFSSCISGFVGMSKSDSDMIINKIKQEVFVPQYQHDHWWAPQGELVLMDQAVTLHNRKIKSGLELKSALTARLAYRSTGDYAGMLDYQPFNQEDFAAQRDQSMRYLIDVDVVKTLVMGWQYHVNLLLPMTTPDRIKYIKESVAEQHRSQVYKELLSLERING